MAKTFRDDLTRDLQDKEFAKGFAAELAKTDFAMLLVRARRAAGITQQELAARAGTTQSYIAKMESGETNPTVGRIGEILALMGLRLTLTLANLDSYLKEPPAGKQEAVDTPVEAGKTRQLVKP